MSTNTRFFKTVQQSKGAVKTGLLIFLIGIALSWLLSAFEVKRFREYLNSQSIEQLSLVRANLEAELNANFYLTRGMVAYVASHPDIDKETFQHIATILLRHKNLIKNIAMAPGNIVSFVYPEEGNTKVLGFDYRESREQWPSIEKIITSGKTIIAGPVQLEQGGTGFICRSPIYLLSPDRTYGDDVYWGVTSVVIDKEGLFNAAGFYFQNSTTRMAIRGIDGMGAAGGIIDGDRNVFQEEPAVLSVSIPGGSWQLGAVPLHGWHTPSPYLLWIRGVGTLVSLAVSLLFFFWVQSREVAQRKIEAALNKANLASQAKTEFLNNMSHEIRTPMNAIIGFVDLTLMDEIPTMVRDNLNIVSKSSRSLMKLLDRILDLNRIEARKLVIESIEFSLHETLFNLESLFHERAADRGNQLIIDQEKNVPDILIGDSLRLEQILINLVGNAIKFTSKGEITVTVICLDKADEKVRLQFSVRDTGIGIAEDNLDDIFNTFTQADSTTTREYGGTGLGLSISKELTLLLGGELKVESSLGKGSTFTCTLPFEFQPDEPEEDILVNNRDVKILIIDDDLDVSTMLRTMLLLEKFEVDTADCAETGMEKMRKAVLENEPFDLVLIDLMMPLQDGISTARLIRDEPRLAQTPIIMMTGYGSEMAVQRAEQVGINGFLHKPIRRRILLENIRIVLSKDHKGYRKGRTKLGFLTPSLLAGRKILLVEDEKYNQLLAEKLLLNAGLRVKIASDGLEALEKLDLSFDAVLMDIQMPNLDGLSAARLIRRCETSQQHEESEHQELLTGLSKRIYGGRIPIIAVTANAMLDDRETCIEAGMDDYITKPYVMKDVLLSLMGSIIGCDQ